MKQSIILGIMLQRMFMPVVCVIFCLALAVDVAAQQDERKPGRRERRGKLREAREPFAEDSGRGINWRELNLSREQQAQMENLRREFQIATAGIRKELAFSEEDLQKEIHREHLDRERIEQLVLEISKLKQQLSEAATENLLALKDMLTAEQRQKLAVSHVPLPDEFLALGLTGEQKKQIRTLLKSSARQRRKLFGELRELRGELRELLLSIDEPDSTHLNVLQAQIAAKDLELERERVDSQLAVRELLSPEQLKLLQLWGVLPSLR